MGQVHGDLLRIEFAEGSGHTADGVHLVLLRVGTDSEVHKAVLPVLLHAMVTL